MNQLGGLILWSSCCGFLNVPFTCGSVSCSALKIVITLTLPLLVVGTSKESARTLQALRVVLPVCRTLLVCVEVAVFDFC